jgi:hypothetical protein
MPVETYRLWCLVDPLQNVGYDLKVFQKNELMLIKRSVVNSFTKLYSLEINMITFLKSFFCCVPTEPPPEEPLDEPSDPNTGMSLTESYRKARRNLIILSGVCLAWSTAQFSVEDPTISVADVALQFDSTSIPLILGILLLCLTYLWVFEFSIMIREVRRWGHAQLDFWVIWIVVRFSLLAISAGALQRSLWTIFLILAMLLLMVLCVLIFTTALMSITMFVRMRARNRASRPSAANAAFEAMWWAIFFAIILTFASLIGFGFVSYQYPLLSSFLWSAPPSPAAYIVFILVTCFVFLSHWLFAPLVSKLFAERPDYRTYRNDEGELVYQYGGDLSLKFVPEEGAADHPMSDSKPKSEDNPEHQSE